MERLAGILALMAFASGATAHAGWPFRADDGLKRGSREYYEARASEPPGARHHRKAGKDWPPQPRPEGQPLPWIHQFHHTHYWPYPYNCQDIASARSIADIQVANGWLEATTFHECHFDPESGKLNSAGMRHLGWVINSVPPEHQQISLAASGDIQRDQMRTRSVQESMSAFAGSVGAMPVQSRIAHMETRPGGEMNAIFKKRLENIPNPVLSKIGTNADSTTGN